MITPLLKTKLHIPGIRSKTVARPQLIARLNEGLHLGHKLTLISAPAGYGKTSLLAEWLAECRGPAGAPPQLCWLSLDAGDNDPARFTTYLAAALQANQDNKAQGAIQAALQASQQQPTSEHLATLVNQIENLPVLVLLVLDDYHLITAQPVHQALDFLIKHQPSNLHLIIATRADPPLPVARLRARGQLTELRQSDLCFTAEETASFLNQQMGLSLTADEVTSLAARTEGWAAGLQMAALSLAGKSNTADFIETFTGTHRYILDYLLEEVLQRTPETIQAFLLRTSILDQLCGPLCDAVMGEPAAHSGQEVLEHLERDNLFIVPLDEQRQWYRYHRLFSDLLHQRLHKAHPEDIATLHEQAAAWYIAQDDVPSAIGHALKAEDFAQAAGLIEQVAESTLMRGEIVTLQRWLDALPDSAIRDYPALCVFHAWNLMLSGKPLDAIETRLREAEQNASSIPGQIAAMRALIATYQSDVDKAIKLAQEALDQLPEENTFLRGFVLWILGIYSALSNAPDATVNKLAELAQAGVDKGNVLIAVISLNHLAESYERRGFIHKAQELYQRALELASDAQGQRLPIAGQPLIGLGSIALQWGDLDTAKGYLKESITLIEQWSEVGALEAYLTLAWIHYMQGDAHEAQAILDKTRQIALQFNVTEVDDWVVALSQAQIWIMQGNLEAAWRWAEERGLHPQPELHLPAEKDMQPEYRLLKYELVTLAYLWLAEGQPSQALKILDAVLPVAERQLRPFLTINICLLRALALDNQGHRKQAMTALEQALHLAEPEGAVQSFFDVGLTALEPLLRDAEAQGIAADFIQHIRWKFTAASSAQTTEIPTEHPVSPTTPTSGAAMNLPEPLSERERDVLRLLPSELSTAAIAEELFISVHTVRSHLKAIYGKLDVHSRYEAIAQAKKLDLL